MTIFHSLSGSACTSASCTSMPPSIGRHATGAGGESSGPTASSRTFAFHLGFVVKMSSAAGSKLGAAMASMKRPGVASTSAVRLSTARLKASTPPKALCGSPSSAFLAASARVAAAAAPHGLLCLMTDAAGSRNTRTMASALSRSSKLLYDSSLP